MAQAGDDNYDSVNMDLSDAESGGSSDNEMFACKDEYKAFKQHFTSKNQRPETESSAGAVSTNEYGGPAEASEEYGGGSSTGPTPAQLKYGDLVAGQGQQGGHQGQDSRGHQRDSRGGQGGHHGGRRKDEDRRGGNSEGRGKIEAGPSLYGERRRSRDRSRSRERHRERRRSGDRGGQREDRRRSRERGGGGRRRSGSRERRSPRKEWGRGSRGDRGRRGDREEHARNMEEQMKKVEEMGVEMPKYMKAGAFNPLSYAEQVQKRKMMWAKPNKTENEEQQPVAAVTNPVAKPIKPEEKEPASKISFNKWETTNFGNETQNEKFRRLMGIKGGTSAPPTQVAAASPHIASGRIQEDLEKNYEVARQQTHRNRGLGLGFSSAEPCLPGSGGMVDQRTPQTAVYPPPGGGGGGAMGAGSGGWAQRPGQSLGGSVSFVRKHH